jgi:AcrR family transcriptional regulator
MPRRGLTREAVLAEAVQLVDTHGYDQLSLTSLAERLSVRPPSLYKHVASVDDVRLGLSLIAYRELEQALAASLEEDSHAPIIPFASAYRRFAQSHPGLVSSTIRVMPGYEEELREAESAAVQPLLRVLDRYGVREPSRQIHLARFVRSALHGFVSIEAADGFARSELIEDSYQTVVESLDLVLRTEKGTPS